MAKQITELTAAGAIAGADLLWLEQGGLPRKVTMTEVSTFTGGGGGGSSPVGSMVLTYNGAASGDPGAGQWTSNNTTITSHQWWEIDDLDDAGNPTSNILQTMLDTGGGYCVIQDVADNSHYEVFSIDTIVDNAGYWRVNVTPLHGTSDTTTIATSTAITFTWFTSAYVPVASTGSTTQSREFLVWNDTDHHWEGSGASFRVNPAGVPTGGRIQLATTSGFNTASPQIDFDLGVSQSCLMYMNGSDATQGIYTRGDTSGAVDVFEYGARTASTNTPLFRFESDNQITVLAGGDFRFAERAASPTFEAGYGYLWVKSDAPNTLWFTDDTGAETQLGAGGGGGRINTDINTATPPTTEAVTGNFEIYDLADDDELATFGYNASNVLEVRNKMTSGDMEFYVDDNVGTQTRIIRLHKGNSASPGQEGYAMFNRVICNYLGSQAFSPDDPPLMVTNSGGDEDGQTQSNLSMWYNSIQAYTASAAAGSTLSINPSGGTVNLGNASGAGTASNVLLANGTLWIAQTKTAGLNLSWRTSTAPSGGAVPNDAYYSITTHAQSHVASFGARASDNSMVLTHDIHGAPWIIEGQNEVGNPRKIATFDTTQATSGVYIGEVNQQSSLWLLEETAAMTSQATWGQIWVKDDIPNTLWFTDDAGTDHQLGAGGGGGTIGGSITDNQIAVGATTADDIEGSANLTYDGTNVTLVGGRFLVDNLQGIESVNAAGNTNLDLDATTSASGVASVRVFRNGVTTTGAKKMIWYKGNTSTTFGSMAWDDTRDGLTLLNDAGLWIGETAAAQTATASFGQWWVRNDAPNTPMFSDDAGNARPLYGISEIYEIDVADTFDAANMGKLWHKDANAAVTFTADNDSTIPQGAMWMVHNDDTEDVTIAQGTGVTIEWLTAGAAPTAGNVVVKQGGIVTVYKYSDTVYWVWGSKDAPGGITFPIEPQDNDKIIFGTGGDFEMYFDGTNMVMNSVVGSFDITLTDLDLDMNDNVILQPVLQDYAIQTDAKGVVTDANQTLTYANGPTFSMDLENWTANRTVTLSGGPPSGTHGQITVIITQDGTAARTITWAGGTFRWAGGTAHAMTTTLNGFTIFTFETWDGGTTWYAAGEDYS